MLSTRLAFSVDLATFSHSSDNTDMPKTTPKLEARLARIEKELADLKAALPKKGTTPWYRQIVGDFAGDPAYSEIIRLGQQIRRGKRRG